MARSGTWRRRALPFVPVTADPRVLVAVDLGTSAVKVGVLGVDGRLRGFARVPYALLLDGVPGRAEQRPDAWWTALVRGVELARAEAEIDGAIQPVSLCVVGQGPTLVATGADGQALAPAITWLDRRAAAETAAAAAAIGRQGWVVGLIGRARLLATLRPEVVDDAAWLLSAWDHVAFRLTGVAAAALQDPSEAITAAEASASGLDERIAPPAVRAGTVIGGLLPGPAAELGLPTDLPVAAGANDAIATFLGAGLTAPGQAIDTGGTSGGFGLYVAGAVAAPPLWTGPAPLPGLHYVGGAMAGTGKALDWLVGEALGGAATLPELLVEAATAPVGSGGLLFLPYLAGERWPLHDPAARGAFVGLTLRHRRAHLVRAVLEAAALALRHVAAPAVAAGLPFSELRVTGGTAASRLWNQVKADTLGVEVAVPRVAEASVAGAAILAAVGIGLAADERAAIDAMVRVAERLAPRPAAQAIYDRLAPEYEDLHARLAPANVVLGAVEASVRR
jgi:xylulokinase